MILKYTIAWIPMVFIAIANGALRQLAYERFLGERSAHQVSCLVGIALFFLYTWVLSLRRPLDSSRQAFAVGLIWIGLTVVFEFLFGHYVARLPWSRLLHDYNLLAGRLWVLVLMAVAVLPYTLFKINS